MLRFRVMLRPFRPPVAIHVLAGALIAAFFLQSLLASLVKSPVFDEPPHIAAGLAYVQKGVFTPNTQHPPLLKEMAAVSLLLAGIRLPDLPSVNRMLRENPGQGIEWTAGNDVIMQGGPRKVMFWARLPLILLSMLAALVIYIWGRRIVGDTAAIGALLLFALDPNLVAHSELVTTDMGMAAFMILFFYFLWTFVRHPRLSGLLLSGLTMGLFLCTKFSAVLLIPVALLLMLAAALAADGQNVRKRLAKACGHFGVMGILACLVIMAVYFSPSGLSAYYHGIHDVYADFAPDYRAYMADELQPRFLSYFAVAWLLKEPLATVGVVAAGSLALIYGRRLAVVDKLFIFLPPFVLFAACTVWAGDIGIRYLIPAFPFLFLAGGAGLAALIQGESKWSRGLAAVVCVWIVAAAAGIYPDHLSYFNEAACLLKDPGKLGWDGGTKCGPWWLDDSNTDWGQGLEQLVAWRRHHPDSRTIQMAYFGSFPPEGYGIAYHAVVGGEFEDPAPGLYVISAKYVSRPLAVWVRTIPPAAIVGHALYIYDIGSGSPGTTNLKAPDK
jgi:Dolichyl-phosphate-mannose-protein mannosyltransferase